MPPTAGVIYPPLHQLHAFRYLEEELDGLGEGSREAKALRKSLLQRRILDKEEGNILIDFTPSTPEPPVLIQKERCLTHDSFKTHKYDCEEISPISIGSWEAETTMLRALAQSQKSLLDEAENEILEVHREFFRVNKGFRQELKRLEEEAIQAKEENARLKEETALLRKLTRNYWKVERRVGSEVGAPPCPSRTKMRKTEGRCFGGSEP